MKTFALFCLLALPALAADTTIVGKVVGVHDGDTLTLRTINETLRCGCLVLIRLNWASLLGTTPNKHCSVCGLR